MVLFSIFSVLFSVCSVLFGPFRSFLFCFLYLKIYIIAVAYIGHDIYLKKVATNFKRRYNEFQVVAMNFKSCGIATNFKNLWKEFQKYLQ